MLAKNTMLFIITTQYSIYIPNRPSKKTVSQKKEKAPGNPGAFSSSFNLIYFNND